jgi:molybdopterin synthase catalytic subunit
MRRSALVTREINPASIIQEVASVEHGATSIFIGTVRDTSDGRGVSGVDYTAYSAMAGEELERILGEAEARFDVGSLVVEHRIGPLALGDVSIVIAAAHAHRAPALDCTRYVIEEIKKRVTIWKMEHFTDGTRAWVDPTRAKETAGA